MAGWVGKVGKFVLNIKQKQMTVEECFEKWWTPKELPSSGFSKTAVLDFAEIYASMPKFKEGDEVMLDGHKVTVINVDPADNERPYKVKCGDGTEFWMEKEDLTPIPFKFKEGDEVYILDFDECKHYGTIHRNVDHPDVSYWYIKYYDGEECAVLDVDGVHKVGPKRTAMVQIDDRDIAAIQVLHDLLLDPHGYSLDFIALKKARELTDKMYKALRS